MDFNIDDGLQPKMSAGIINEHECIAHRAVPATLWRISSPICSDAVSEWSRWALAHPEFGVSVNSIPTREDRLCPPYYCLPIWVWKSNGISDILCLNWEIKQSIQKNIRGIIRRVWALILFLRNNLWYLSRPNYFCCSSCFWISFFSGKNARKLCFDP